MAKSNNIIGVILCGGLSTRMGEDKGSKTIDGKHWALHIHDLFIHLGINTIVSINENQKEHYTSFFDSHQLIVDNGYMNLNGPLKGILSIHDKYPTKDLFVIACDMISLEPKTLELIIQEYHIHHKKHTDTYIPRNQQHLQPLVGIYTSKGLTRLKSYAEEESINNKSMMHCIRKGTCTEIDFDESFDYQFDNFNSPQDLIKRNTK